MHGARYPSLSLQSIAVDGNLARQLPRGLAYYYLTLPLARDEEGISLVMAHPEDRTAIGVLESVLGGPVIPVRGVAEEIRSALDALWGSDSGSEAPYILHWDESNGTPGIVRLVAEVLGAEITWLDAHLNDLETAMMVAREGHYRLIVIDADHQRGGLPRILRESKVPLLLVRNAAIDLRYILLVLRGHSPDDSALNWIIPIAQATGASVTLLAVSPLPLPFYTREARLLQGIPVLLSPDSPLGEHVLSCACRLNEAGVQGTLRLRQGYPDAQIADEITQGDYGLVAIAAEGHGAFVQQVLDEIEARSPQATQPLLIIKPAAL